jgi:hypothetical protein
MNNPLYFYCETDFDKNPHLKETYNKLLSECKIFRNDADKRGVRDGAKTDPKPCINEDLFLRVLACSVCGYQELKARTDKLTEIRGRTRKRKRDYIASRLREMSYSPDEVKEEIKKYFDEFFRMYLEGLHRYGNALVRGQKSKIVKQIIEWRERALNRADEAIESIKIPLNEEDLRTVLQQDIAMAFQTFVLGLSTRSIQHHIKNICKCFDIPYRKSPRRLNHRPKSR